MDNGRHIHGPRLQVAQTETPGVKQSEVEATEASDEQQETSSEPKVATSW